MTLQGWGKGSCPASLPATLAWGTVPFGMRWGKVLLIAFISGAAGCTDSTGALAGSCNEQDVCLPGLYCIEGRCQAPEFARVHYCLGKQCGVVNGFECGTCSDPKVCRGYECELYDVPVDSGVVADAAKRADAADPGDAAAEEDGGKPSDASVEPDAVVVTDAAAHDAASEDGGFAADAPVLDVGGLEDVGWADAGPAADGGAPGDAGQCRAPQAWATGRSTSRGSRRRALVWATAFG